MLIYLYLLSLFKMFWGKFDFNQSLNNLINYNYRILDSWPYRIKILVHQLIKKIDTENVLCWIFAHTSNTIYQFLTTSAHIHTIKPSYKHKLWLHKASNACLFRATNLPGKSFTTPQLSKLFLPVQVWWNNKMEQK